MRPCGPQLFFPKRALWASLAIKFCALGLKRAPKKEFPQISPRGPIWGPLFGPPHVNRSNLPFLGLPPEILNPHKSCRQIYRFENPATAAFSGATRTFLRTPGGDESGALFWGAPLWGIIPTVFSTFAPLFGALHVPFSAFSGVFRHFLFAPPKYLPLFGSPKWLK